MDNKSIAHARWNCTCHIVFIPKYRRRIMYGELRKDIVEILKRLCEMEQVELINDRVCGESYPRVCNNCTKAECIRVHVVSKREKCPDDF